MENQTEIDTFIGLAVVSLICLAMIVILFFTTYRKKIFEKEAKIKTIQLESQLEIFKSATEAEEKQKEKIAKNLHDGIIPTLSAVERSLDKNIRDFGGVNFDLERLKKDLRYIEDIGKNIRGISHDLVPQSLISLGLINALKDYISQINSADSQVDFENNTPFEDNTPFSNNEQLNIYRICLELLNNLFKHSQYKYLKLIVENNERVLEFIFMHDGKGITNEEIEKLSNSSKGLGLKSLKSRALMMNAEFNYIVEKETASVILTVPFRK